MLMKATTDLCVDCGQPHSGKNNAKVCRRCYTSRRRKAQNLCDLCFDPITRNAKRCRRCSYPRHGNPRYKVVDLPPAQELRPQQLPLDVVDTLLSGRPWMRLAVEEMASTAKRGEFKLLKWAG